MNRWKCASHWPMPNEFDAAQRLFSSLFTAQRVAFGEALGRSQTGLMDDPDTSHPFYWTGFAIVGDDVRPLPGL